MTAQLHKHHWFAVLIGRQWLPQKKKYDLLNLYFSGWNILGEPGQYHGCWWPGDRRSQVISSNDIDHVGYMGSCLTQGRILKSLHHLNIKKWQKMQISSFFFFNIHDDVIKWKHFPRYWPFVRGIHRPPVNSPHKGQWRRALMFSLICV